MTTIPTHHTFPQRRSTMPQCDGCSKFYKFLDGDRCVPCSESNSEPKPRVSWPLCPHCSKRFEFIDGKKPCLMCQDRDSRDTMSMPPPPLPLPGSRGALSSTAAHNQLDDIQYAMTHPVNARTHSARDTPTYRNPLQSYDQHRNGNENDVSI